VPQNFDVILKKLFQSLSPMAMKALTGVEVVQWIDKELPHVQNRRADLLGRTRDGDILHLEFDTEGRADLPLRQATYYLDVYRSQGRPPRQILIYVGRRRVKIPHQLVTAEMKFRFTVIDLRDLSGEQFLASDSIDDQILSVLMELRSQRLAIRRIVENITLLHAGRRVEAIRKLLLLSGLRSLEEIVAKEVIHVPVHYDIMKHKVIGPQLRAAIELGQQQGREQGIEQGIEKGKQELLTNMLRLRFKRIPTGIKARLASASGDQITQWSLRLLSAKTIQEVFSE
jgi:hypothetical protein